jgi:hypothetical protein
MISRKAPCEKERKGKLCIYCNRVFPAGWSVEPKSFSVCRTRATHRLASGASNISLRCHQIKSSWLLILQDESQSYKAAIRICTYSHAVTASYFFGLSTSSQHPGSASTTASMFAVAKKGML